MGIAPRPFARCSPIAVTSRFALATWLVLAEEDPFALLFLDARQAKVATDEVLALVEPGGMIVLDDLTPEDRWPDEWRGMTDLVRTPWLNHPGVVATEILTSPTAAAILAVRIA